MSDIKGVRGDTNVYNIVVLRQDTPIDLTGAKVWFSAKRQRTDLDADAIILLDSAGGGINIYDPLHGKLQVIVPPSDTEDLDEEEVLYYDVQLKEANGIITTIASGKITITLDVTRAIV